MRAFPWWPDTELQPHIYGHWLSPSCQSSGCLGSLQNVGATSILLLAATGLPRPSPASATNSCTCLLPSHSPVCCQVSKTPSRLILEASNEAARESHEDVGLFALNAAVPTVLRPLSPQSCSSLCLPRWSVSRLSPWGTGRGLRPAASRQGPRGAGAPHAAPEAWALPSGPRRSRSPSRGSCAAAEPPDSFRVPTLWQQPFLTLLGVEFYREPPYKVTPEARVSVRLSPSFYSLPLPAVLRMGRRCPSRPDGASGASRGP